MTPEQRQALVDEHARALAAKRLETSTSEHTAAHPSGSGPDLSLLDEVDPAELLAGRPLQ